jgi:Cu-processing system permease protein
VARWQVMLGKFAGHVGILAIATVLGYGTAFFVNAIWHAPPAAPSHPSSGA